MEEQRNHNPPVEGSIPSLVIIIINLQMDYFISFIAAFMFGTATLVIGVQNPIHSILILIVVFFLGSLLLFMLSLDYFALLFLIVYVGAIVVLFLFIVMMLEIKMVNVTERFRDLLSFKSLVVFFFALQLLIFVNENLWDLAPLFSADDFIGALNNIKEGNLYVDYSKVLYQLGQLRVIGSVLFTEHMVAIILISILLFISMFGSIVLTLESFSNKIIKEQDANLQGIRNPSLSITSYRSK